MRPAALVSSVLLPVLLVGCSDPPARTAPTSPALATASTSPSPSTPTTAAPARPWDLPSGPPPRWGYTVDGVHVAPDGTRTRLPRRHGITAVTSSDRGLLVADARIFEGTNGLSLVTDGDARPLGRPLEGFSGAGVASPDGRRLAWVSFTVPETGSTAPTRLHVLTPHGRMVTELPRQRDVSAPSAAVAFRGPDVVVQRVFGEEALLVDPTGATPPRPTAPPRGRDRPPSAASLGLPDGLRVVDAVREPTGDLLVVAERSRATALLRVRGSGRVELLTPVLPPARSKRGTWPAYVLDQQEVRG